MMKLFQIEEPDGAPADPDASGVAIGIDASGPEGFVAVSVGGNAELLSDREGFEANLPVPARDALATQWEAFFSGARLRAERALARPVTHAVVALSEPSDAALASRITDAASNAGLVILNLCGPMTAASAAALAEDLAR